MLAVVVPESTVTQNSPFSSQVDNHEYSFASIHGRMARLS